MALIERVSLNEPQTIVDRSVHVSEVVPSSPGLRISSRLTTSSLSDYPQFDLTSIGRADKSGVVTDGASS